MIMVLYYTIFSITLASIITIGQFKKLSLKPVTIEKNKIVKSKNKINK